VTGDQGRSRVHAGLRLGQEGAFAGGAARRSWWRWVGLSLLCLVVGVGSAPRWASGAETPPLPPISALPSQPVLISPTDPILPQRAELSGYHFHHQRHRLSCEAAAVSMATGGQLSEEAILAALRYDANPWRGFRGSYTAVTRLKNGLRDYGIYALPLADELQGLGYATAVINGDQAPALLRYSVGVLKKPVVVWVTWRLRPWPAVTVGVGRERLRLILHEHTRVVVGYDARRVHFLDPFDGERWDSWPHFLASWALFGNMGLMVARPYPATAPLTVTGALVEHTHQAVWSWTPRQPLTSAMVTLYQAGTAVWQGQAPLTTTTPQPVATGPPVTSTLAVTGTQAISLPIQAGLPYTVAVQVTDPLGHGADPVTSTESVLLAQPSTPPAGQADGVGTLARWAAVPVGLVYQVAVAGYTRGVTVRPAAKTAGPSDVAQVAAGERTPRGPRAPRQEH